MFRPIAAIFRLLQFFSKSGICMCVYMTHFEQNCNILKMAAIGQNMQLFFAIKHHHKSILPQLCFMTDIYLTITLSTHNGDDTPQNRRTATLQNTLFIYLVNKYIIYFIRLSPSLSIPPQNVVYFLMLPFLVHKIFALC